jgi:hypothetical protein
VGTDCVLHHAQAIGPSCYNEQTRYTVLGDEVAFVPGDESSVPAACNRFAVRITIERRRQPYVKRQRGDRSISDDSRVRLNVAGLPLFADGVTLVDAGVVQVDLRAIIGQSRSIVPVGATSVFERSMRRSVRAKSRSLEVTVPTGFSHFEVSTSDQLGATVRGRYVEEVIPQTVTAIELTNLAPSATAC